MPSDSSQRDQHVVFRDIGWKGYAQLVALRGERPFPKLTFLRGDLELMSPGMPHEDDKTRLARLLEAWADELDLPLEGFGSWTLKSEEAERGVEPDECYLVGDRRKRKFTAPDIAIEVVHSSGSVNKLEVYRGFGVREVWFWRSGELSFWRLVRGRYVSAKKSALLPNLDPKLIEVCMKKDTQQDAVRHLRKALALQSTRTSRRR